MGNGVYEEALVCSLAGGNAKWITVSHITKQVLGWHWGRASDQTGVIPGFVLLHRVLHIQYLFFLCTLSIKFPWEVAAVVAATLTVSWILPTASHRVFFLPESSHSRRSELCGVTLGDKLTHMALHLLSLKTNHILGHKCMCPTEGQSNKLA